MAQFLTRFTAGKIKPAGVEAAGRQQLSLDYAFLLYAKIKTVYILNK
jgi:hypothetical protein